MRGGGRVVAVLLAGLTLAGCNQNNGAGGRPRPQRVTLTPTPAAAMACLILTDPHAENALTVNAGAVVDAPRCEAHVVSRAEPAAVLNADSKLDVATLCVAGDINRHGGLVSQPLEGCAAAVDPDADRPPPAEAAAPCDDRPHVVNGGAVRLAPGVYCGGLAFHDPHVTFAPGLYVIRGGDWTFDGGVYVGREVSLYFADTSKPVFNSGVDIDLAAAVSGPRAGLLMDEARGLAPSTLTFNDARRLNLEGVVHLPSRHAVFNAGSKLTSSAFTGVFDTAVLNQTRWTLGWPAQRMLDK